MLPTDGPEVLNTLQACLQIILLRLPLVIGNSFIAG